MEITLYRDQLAESLGIIDRAEEELTIIHRKWLLWPLSRKMREREKLLWSRKAAALEGIPSLILRAMENHSPKQRRAGILLGCSKGFRVRYMNERNLDDVRKWLAWTTDDTQCDEDTLEFVRQEIEAVLPPSCVLKDFGDAQKWATHALGGNRKRTGLPYDGLSDARNFNGTQDAKSRVGRLAILWNEVRTRRNICVHERAALGLAVEGLMEAENSGLLEDPEVLKQLESVESGAEVYWLPILDMASGTIQDIEAARRSKARDAVLQKMSLAMKD